MSQHNILRRLRKLEREAKARANAETAHLGCVPFHLTEDEFSEVLKVIDQWHPTNEIGAPISTPVCIDELAEGLRAGQNLLMSGIVRIQILDED